MPPAWAANVTLSGRVGAGIVTALYLVQLAAPGVRRFIALVPARFVPCVWTLLTAGALETRLVKAVFSAAGALLAAQVLDPVWGARELARFAAVAGAVSTGATLVATYVWYVLNVYSKDAGKILFSEFSGAHGILAACLVALKQVLPDNEVTLLGWIKFRVRHLPGLFVVAAAAVAAATGTLLATVPSTLAGAYGGWLYLRYAQPKPESDLRGDPSAAFALSAFFPATLAPAVDRASGVCARTLRLVAEPTVVSADMLGGAPLSEEAARRRERGARALEERLANKSTKAAVSDVEAGPSSA